MFEGLQTNLYSYVNSDPINYIDPEGTVPIAIALVPIGAGVLSGLISGGLNAYNANSCKRDAFIEGFALGFAGGSAGAIGAGTVSALVGIGAGLTSSLISGLSGAGSLLPSFCEPPEPEQPACE